MSKNSHMDEEEWEVESILDKSTSKNGRTLYLVKWKNFNEAASSWEPVENLCCPELLAKFEEELETQNQSEADAAAITHVVPGLGVISSGAISSTGRPMVSIPSSPAQPSRSDREKSADSAVNAQRRDSNSTCKTETVAECKEICTSERSFSSGRDEEALLRAAAKFEEGYIPEKIVGAICIQDSIRFLIKWRDRIECDLVHSKIARQKCPQLILDFYEKNIQWM